MIIGTHNSMTYNRPLHWWGRLAQPFSRCQGVGVNAQWRAGARCFDLRIRFDRQSAKPCFAHGLVRYRGDVEGAIANIAKLSNDGKETAFVRLILEDLHGLHYNERLFTDFCDRMVRKHKRIMFFGGNRKGDWAQVYTFKFAPSELRQCVGSMAADARWYEKLLPWLYARRMNAHNYVAALAASDTYTIALFDYYPRRLSGMRRRTKSPKRGKRPRIGFNTENHGHEGGRKK